MNGRSSLSSTHNIDLDLCRIVGHGAARLQPRFIKACPTARMPLCTRWRRTLRWTKRFCGVFDRGLQSQPSQLRMIGATVTAKSP